MMKGILGLLAFIFCLIVLILMLTGSYILRFIRNFRKAAEQAADQEVQRHREETGRQRQQYGHRQQAQTTSRQRVGDEEIENPFYQGPRSEQPKQDEPRRTQTATGETIIDHRHQNRENKKIFDDSDGEYVDFVEES